jgi:hypothetical protein
MLNEYGVQSLVLHIRHSIDLSCVGQCLWIVFDTIDDVARGVMKGALKIVIRVRKELNLRIGEITYVQPGWTKNFDSLLRHFMLLVIDSFIQLMTSIFLGRIS